MTNKFDVERDNAWCPGCGNFPILTTIKKAVADLSIAPKDLVITSGIGQADKLPHYLRCNLFNGLHGRALPAATGIKLANPHLTVIIVSGDGGTYGEGGNHFLHTVRRNPDLTAIIHDNRVYGLTKGQASPTSDLGFKTPIQVHGVYLEPFNPIAVAIALDASLVAQANSADIEQSKEVIKQAVQHKGFSLVNMLQPCVTFNKVNNYQWFKEHSYYLSEEHDSSNKVEAFRIALDKDKLPLGVIFKNPVKKKTFEEHFKAYDADKRALFERNVDEARLQKVKAFLESTK